ncbi:MAG: glycosyltransferase [Defluviitaleaceae bacterium]|nr:glycosyltransferase [Defluviitaleaceae bacterium]
MIEMMEMIDVISVIVPVYNAEKHLENCICSIVNQTYKNLEIILVNDGSADDSGKICDNFAKIDSRIKVIHKENGGVSSARNKGIDAATGDWLGFVDSDDIIDSTMYETLLNAAVAGKTKLSICGFVRSFDSGYKEVRTCPEIPPIITCKQALTYIISDRYFEGFMCNKLFHKTLFTEFTEQNKPKNRLATDLHVCEDLLLIIQIILQMAEKSEKSEENEKSEKNKISYTPQALYDYIVRTESAVNSISEKRLTDITARERIITLLSQYSAKLGQSAKSRYTDAIIGIMYLAVCSENHENYDYLPALRKKARKYLHIYLFATDIALRMKIRNLTILLAPKLSYKLWQTAKKYFNITWYKELKNQKKAEKG